MAVRKTGCPHKAADRHFSYLAVAAHELHQLKDRGLRHLEFLGTAAGGGGGRGGRDAEQSGGEHRGGSALAWCYHTRPASPSSAADVLSALWWRWRRRERRSVRQQAAKLGEELAAKPARVGAQLPEELYA